MRAWWTACLVLVAAPAMAQYDVVDTQGHAVHFERAPQRVVSLLPSLTETVCALGACGRLVATDRYSDFPASVVALPKAGGLDDAQIELIAALRPDVVLLDRSQRVADRLAQLGIRTFAVGTETFADIARSVTVVAAVLDLAPAGERLNAGIAQAVDAAGAAARARRAGKPAPRVYFEVDPTPYAAGEGSFIGELLARLGVGNIVPSALGPFPKLNPEYIVRQNPDVIFTSAAEAPRLADRPGWAGLRAVRDRRVCVLGKAENDTVVRPGPRVADGMRALDACLAQGSP